MTEQEKKDFEREVREQIAAEKRAAKAAWRKKNREHIRQYDKIYRLKKKMCGKAIRDEK